MTRQSWLEHALWRSGWQPQRQMLALAALGFFIVLILGALYLYQVASEATTNRRLSEMLEERDELERFNEQLRAEIATFKSVPRLQERARELGFEIADRSRLEYLVVKGYVPEEVDTVAPLVSVEETDESDQVYDETFIGWLQQQWDAVFGGG